MKTLKLFLLAVACTSLVGAVDAQGETSLVLTQEDFGQSFTVRTGTLIDVSLQPFGDMYVSYDPMLLQLVAYEPVLTEGQSYPVESGVVVPEIVNGVPAAASPGNPPVGQSDEVTAPEATVEPVVGLDEGVIGDTQVIVGTGVAVSGTISTGGTPVQLPTARWQLKAIRAGDTLLEIRSFRPPCRDRVCPMMPEFSYSVNLNITGEAQVEAPVTVDAITQQIGLVDNEKTVKTTFGTVIVLNLPNAGQPYRVVYNPIFVQFLPGNGPRFQVIASGVQTILGIQRDEGMAFMVTLEVEAECDSCGVRGG